MGKLRRMAVSYFDAQVYQKIRYGVPTDLVTE
jgi:hypothetical protein